MSEKFCNTSQRRTAGLTNTEIVILAAYKLDAEFKHVGTEHIAIKAHELAPGRFTWKHYKSQVDIEAVRKRLFDALKPKDAGYLIGSQKLGWMLTDTGRQFAKSNLSRLKSLGVTENRLSSKEKAWSAREKIRMKGEMAFRKYKEGNIENITSHEADRFFRLDDYVIGNARTAKIERAKNLFANNPEFRNAILAIETFVSEK